MLVKICGISNIEDAQVVLSAGADWIGLNLVAGPRRIDLGSAEAILRALDDPAQVVAPLALDDSGADQPTLSMLRARGVRRLQLYGDVTPESIARLDSAGFDCIVVLHVDNEATFESIDKLLAACGEHRPSHLLFDGGSPQQLGGTGRVADWELIARARDGGRCDDWPPLILAGGLNPDNVAEGLQRVRPAGVDVSSGVKSSPGKKDTAKVAAFVEAVRDRR